jgi:hypothetical protein
MKSKNSAARKRGTKAKQESTAIELSRQGIIPYSLGDRKDTEDYFEIKFKSDRHYQYFCWCLSNNWQAFSNQALVDIKNDVKNLCEEGSQLSVPEGWTAEDTE